MHLISWPIKFSCTRSLLCEPSLAHHLRITEFGGLWQTLNTGGQGYLWNDAISRWTSDSLLIKLVILLSLQHFTNESTFTILACYFVYDLKCWFSLKVTDFILHIPCIKPIIKNALLWNQENTVKWRHWCRMTVVVSHPSDVIWERKYDIS